MPQAVKAALEATKLISRYDGIYTILYAGKDGEGMAMAVLRDRRIVGADINGGSFNGAFEVDEEGVQISLVFNFVDASNLVTGNELMGPLQHKTSFKLTAAVLTKSEIALLDFGFGPINTRFKLASEI